MSEKSSDLPQISFCKTLGNFKRIEDGNINELFENKYTFIDLGCQYETVGTVLNVSLWAQFGSTPYGWIRMKHLGPSPLFYLTYNKWPPVGGHLYGQPGIPYSPSGAFFRRRLARIPRIRAHATLVIVTAPKFSVSPPMPAIRMTDTTNRFLFLLRSTF